MNKKIDNLPEPQSRIEKFLYTIATDDVIKNSFNNNDYTKLVDGEEIPATLLSVLTSVAVSSGILIKNNDDLYDLGRIFYDYVKSHNDLTWDTVNATFSSSVGLLTNNLVSTDSKFLDVIKEFFNTTFNGVNSNSIITNGHLSTCIGLPYFGVTTAGSQMYNLANAFTFNEAKDFWLGDVYFKLTESVTGSAGTRLSYSIYYGDKLLTNRSFFLNDSIRYGSYAYGGTLLFYYASEGSVNNYDSFTICYLDSVGIVKFTYTGGYDWDNVESKKENNKISLPIPKNLGNLVGQSKDEFYNNTDNLVGKDNILIPVIDNASINICEPYSFFNGSNNESNYLPEPQSRVEKLLYAMITGDDSNIEPPNSRIEQYLNYMLKNNI